MRRSIYLFCNEGYGAAYLSVLRMVASQMEEYDSCVVLSPRRSARARRFTFRDLKGLARIAGFLGFGRRISSPIRGATVLTVGDVNDPRFIASVPLGSYGFVAGFNQIFRKPLIERFSSIVNFHPSLLPYYRGAIPSYWVIQHGETMTGITAHELTEKVDSGEILYQELVEINPGMSESELDQKIASVGSCYFRECLQHIKLGAPFRRKRVEASYAHKLDYVPSTRRQ